MGVRLKGEYYSTGGLLWTWQLIDTAFGDLQHDTQLSSEGLVFTWDGESRTKDSRFINGKCDLTIMINHANISALRDDMINSQEARFFLRAGIGTVSYIGKLSVDGGEYEDNTYPYPFKLQAVDGIGALTGINYSDTSISESPYADQPTLLDHVFNCLDKTGIKTQYTGQEYLWVVCNYYEDQHANTTDNPLDKTRVDAKAFYDIAKESNTYDFKSCMEVLRNILLNMNAQLYYAGPHYIIQQRSERATSSFRVFKYSTARALISSSTISADLVISNAGNVNFRKGISSFGFLPGLRSAKIIYNHGAQDVNLLSGISYSGDNNHSLGYTMVTVGTIDVKTSENVVLRFYGKLKLRSEGYDTSGSSIRWRNHRYHFRLYLHSSYTGHDLWWDRAYASYDFYAPQYGIPTWKIDAGTKYFDFVTDIHDLNQLNLDIFKEIGFDTPAFGLTAGYLHTIQFGFELVRVFDEKGNTVVGASNPFQCNWEFSDLSLLGLKDGTILERPTKTVSEVTGDLNNTASFNEETIIGDGPGKSSIGRLQVWNGTEWKDSALWKAAGTGTSRKLHLVVAQEIVASQQTSLLVVQGGFYSKTATAMSRLSYAGLYFLMMSATYRTSEDEWTGEWAQIITPARTGITWSGKTKIDTTQVPIPKNPDKLPNDENKEDRILGITTLDEIKHGTAIATIPLLVPATVDLWHKNDVVNLIDPVTGNVQKITVNADVKKGDTAVSIVSVTPVEDYPPGSYLKIDNQYILNNNYAETNEDYMYVASFAGTNLTCTHPLTDLTLESSSILISKRHRVYKNGQKLVYGHAQGWSINNTGNLIVFGEACTGDTIEVYSYKTKKVY